MFLTNEKNECAAEKNNLENQINKLTNQLNVANTSINKPHNQIINFAYNSMSKFTNIVYDENKKELRVNNLGKFVKSSLGKFEEFEIEFNKYLPNDGKTYYMKFFLNSVKNDVGSIVCYPIGAFAPFGGIFLIFNTDEHNLAQTPYKITWDAENQMVYLTFSNFNLRNFLKYVDIELKQTNYDRIISSNDDNGLRDFILLLSYGNQTIFI